MADVEFTIEGSIAVLRLNRPEKLNAITYDMLEAIEEHLREVDANPAIRALVLTGTGRAFSAGTDLGRLESERGARSRSRPESDRTFPPDSPAPWRFTAVRKPTVAAVNGVAVGIGVELPLQCDFRIAGESARFGWVFVHRGLIPDTGAGTWLLSRAVGLQNAAYLVFSGEIISAQRAKEIGFLLEVVPDAELMDRALDLARSVSKGGPSATVEAKRMLYRGLGRDPDTHLSDHRATMQRLFASEDHHEGVRSFIEKRQPAWTGN
jgi:enoyl-CoA hydratase/carnithine racemase